MSLLSPEVRVALLPDRAGLAVRGRAPMTGLAEAGGLAALDVLLADSSVHGRVHVTLSHHHVRLFLLPAPAAWLRAREMRPWLEDRLAASLGNVADWRLTWDPAPPGRPVLAAAMRGALLDELAATLGRHRLALAAVRPWLAAAWRRRRRLTRGDGWYALLEPGCATLLRLARGRPVGLRQRAIDGEPATQLAAMLARESLLADAADGGELWLERAGVGGDWSGLRQRHPLHELAGPSDPAQALLV